VTKGKRKIGGSHSTLIEGAAILIKEISKLPGLHRYAPGLINPKSKARGGGTKIVYTQLNAECLLAKFVTPRGTQEVRFYGDAIYLQKEINEILQQLQAKK